MRSNFCWQLLACISLLAACNLLTNSIDDVSVECGISKATINLDMSIYIKPLSENSQELSKDDIAFVEIDDRTVDDISPKGCMAVPRQGAHWLRIVTKSQEAYYQKLGQSNESILKIKTSSFNKEPGFTAICRANESLTTPVLKDRLNRLQEVTTSRNLNTLFNLISSERSATKIELKLQPQRLSLADEIAKIPDGNYQIESKLELENKSIASITETPCFLNVDSTKPEVSASLQGDSLDLTPQNSLSFKTSEPSKILYRISKNPMNQECGCGVDSEVCHWTDYQSPITFNEPGSTYLEYCAVDPAGNFSRIQSKQIRIDNVKPTLNVAWHGETPASAPKVATYSSANFALNIGVDDDSKKPKVECRVSVKDLRNQVVGLLPVCDSQGCQNQSLANFQSCSGAFKFHLVNAEYENAAYVVTVNVKASDPAGNISETSVSRINKKYLGEFFEFGKAIPGKVDANAVGEFAGKTWIVSDSGLYTLDGSEIVNRS